MSRFDFFIENIASITLTTPSWRWNGELEISLGVAASLTYGFPDSVQDYPGGAEYPVDNIQSFQPLGSTQIQAVHVREGMLVKKDQLLATLDPTFTEADAKSYEEKHRQLEAKVARLRAEKNKTECESAEGNNYSQLEYTIFKTRQQLFLSKSFSFEQEYKDLQNELELLKSDLASTEKQLGLSAQVERMYSELQSKNAASKAEYLKVLDRRIGMERELAKSKKSAAEIESKMAQNRINYELHLRDWDKQILEELIDDENELARVVESLNKANRLKNLVELRAPMEAIVLEIGNFSIGSVVQEAERMFTLVPVNVPIECEIYIDTEDIGNVKLGDDVKIKLDTFPYIKHGTLGGVMETISEDAFESTPSSRSMGTEKKTLLQRYYKGKVRITANHLTGVPEDFRLIPGMTLAAEIKVGKERIIHYLLHPIFRVMDESMREPR